MPLAVEDVCARAKRAQQRKDRFRSLLQDCYRYAMPERDAFSTYAEGQRRDLHVYDSTAVMATTRFANRLQSVLCPPGRRWALLKPGDDIPEPAKLPFARALESASARLFAHIHESNFDAAVNEMFHDLAASTGFLLVEGRMPGRVTGPILRHTAVPSGLIAWEEGPHGAIEGVFYDLRIRVDLVARTFPDGTVPSQLAQKKGHEEITILLATYYQPDDDRYAMDAIWEKERIVSRSYRTNPWIIAPWLRAPGELEGRGPLVQALADIKTANKVVELVLKNATFAVNGVYTAVDDGVINPGVIRIVPGAVIPVGSNGGPRGASLLPLPRSGDFSVAEIVLEKLQMAIKKALFDTQLPPDAGPVRSATEIVQRMKELQQDIGAPFGRLISNFITPYVTRALDILAEAGEIDLQQLKVDGRQVKIVPISPLANAQALDDVQSITDAVQVLGFMGPQAIAAGLKIDDVPRFVTEKLGVPASLIPTAAEIAQMKRQAAQQAAGETLAKSPVAAQIAKGAMAAMAPASPPSANAA